jgi:hypothetical protein
VRGVEPDGAGIFSDSQTEQSKNRIRVCRRSGNVSVAGRLIQRTSAFCVCNLLITRSFGGYFVSVEGLWFYELPQPRHGIPMPDEIEPFKKFVKWQVPLRSLAKSASQSEVILVVRTSARTWDYVVYRRADWLQFPVAIPTHPSKSHR